MKHALFALALAVLVGCAWVSGPCEVATGQGASCAAGGFVITWEGKKP